MYDVGKLIIAVLYALNLRSMTRAKIASEVIADLPELGSAAETARLLDGVIENLLRIGLIERSPPASEGGQAEYRIAVPLETVAPLLQTLGRDPWSRLSGWEAKLSGPHTMRLVTEASIAPTPPSDRYYVQEVLFATDRRANAAAPDITFGSERALDGALTYGRAEVSIPNDHELGFLESPQFIRLEFHPDPEKHVTVLSSRTLSHDDFYGTLATKLRPETASVLVFVHGYNVRFEDAVRRTAQIAFDLQYDGVAVTYSWPSRGELVDYAVDENNAEWSQPHFARFLHDVAKAAGAARVNIIAHSMGNRLVARSLATLSAQPGYERLSSVVLAAPDIDRDVFLQMADAVAAGARNVTLYASSFDRALRASKLVHGYARAGDCGENVVVHAGIQTVDVSSVSADFTGHGYFGANVNVVSDLYYLLRGQAPRRFRLRRELVGTGGYWQFVP